MTTNNNDITSEETKQVDNVATDTAASEAPADNTATDTAASEAPADNTFEFKAEQYATYIRSASANRASTFATLYKTTLNFQMFKEHADKLALAFSTSTGIDSATLGLVAMVIKLPEAAYVGLEAKARLTVQVKPSLKLEDEFAKLLVPFLTALATVSKYCTVS